MSPDEKAWQAVRSRIAVAARRASRDPAAVELLAVSKAQPAAKVRAAYALGQRAFGENYVQEASLKSGQLSDLSDIEWHLIGPLQSNKTRLAAALFGWVQSIDRLKTAERLSAARDAHAAPLNVCVQVNISGEPSKSGVAPADALALARAVSGLPSLALRGFMGIAEETADVERQRRQFRSLRGLFDAARAGGLAVDTLSMGMSADLEAAVAEGATLVRIGTALFGERTNTTEHEAT
ncbi:MAG: YggS family pyridoxal phosphate-dependent enzyme [Betaproteobacteria bacterium]|nr:MAG: YggS family pyridoxal phosphate-dependent enzyme [Betaproteobacteria bacterium]TMH23549.1 MAG: YggS family pyridoxal phosphate-dependent enzyme [Betaproteobacteria bacterium]TMK08714.1 MAG: YggS family pyridoxal phosphate-dependent enzyme [Alphaproteobacteria bacterium]